MANPNAVKTTEITLAFKDMSSKIAILEKRRERVGLKKAQLENVRSAYNALNSIVTGDTWGQDPQKIVYDDTHIQSAEREIKSIQNHLEELRYSLYD